ncbi:DUF2993 domain-containing protein [Saccharomonospora sp. NPDC046836]|uniref:LmeA family phospholipid-binding protein n=1 Tax=Saccharomonospora sp. NPDC046836 TaxID=3156921 RepID=UPI0033C27E82
MTQQARPPERSKGRRARRLVVVLLVLLGLLVGADFAAAAFAEHTVSQKAREQLGLTEDPAVTIHGFPFSTQALGGDYGHISVSAQGVPVGDALSDVAVNAELHDVTAPLSDLTAGNVDNITIGRLEGQVTLKASDIAKVSPLNNIQDLRIDPSSEAYVRHGDGADGKPQEEKEDSTAGVRLSGRVQIAGQEVQIFAFAMIQLDGTTIRITPRRLQFGNDQETTVVPQQVQQALLPNFEADINAGNLPFTVTPTAIRVDPGSITIKGEASNVNFAGVSAE